MFLLKKWFLFDVFLKGRLACTGHLNHLLIIRTHKSSAIVRYFLFISPYFPHYQKMKRYSWIMIGIWRSMITECDQVRWEQSMSNCYHSNITFTILAHRPPGISLHLSVRCPNILTSRLSQALTFTTSAWKCAFAIRANNPKLRGQDLHFRQLSWSGPKSDERNLIY